MATLDGPRSMANVILCASHYMALGSMSASTFFTVHALRVPIKLDVPLGPGRRLAGQL